MRAMTGLIAAVAVMGATATSAQEVVHWSMPMTAVHGQYTYFPMGTPLRLVTRSELSTQASRPGDRFYMEVAEPLVYHGQVVVPAGSIAAGEVMRVERTGMGGKRGQLAIRPLYVQTPSGPIRLSGRADSSGKGQGVLAIGGALVVWWPMIFIHGTSARLPVNTSVNAYLAEDLRFPVVATVAAAQSSGSPVAAAIPPARPVAPAFAANP